MTFPKTGKSIFWELIFRKIIQVIVTIKLIALGEEA